jgi:hypothetical protein
MPQQHLENLITRLHDEFSPGQSSPQQQQLLRELQSQPPHPSAKDSAAILREIIETLSRLGL